MQKRKDLAPDDIEKLSQSILEKFKSLSFHTVRYLHIFYPIIGKHEFNSLILVNWLKSNYPKINLVLPKSNFGDQSLSNILWEAETPLAMNQWGITEPEHGFEVRSEEIDMVIVPLLAFDTSGNRIGYGKGFYDRFLSDCRTDVQKIGLSFFEPEDKFETIDAFDIPLTTCITPTKVWQFTGA